MTPEQFAYWLQGFAELNQQAPNQEQWQAIRDHLQLVFKKQTPVYSPITDRLSSPNDKWLYNPGIQPVITC